MVREYPGTYESDGVLIEYTYHVDTGSWELPPSSEVEIKSMKFEGVDVHYLLANVAECWYDELIDTIEESHKDRI